MASAAAEIGGPGMANVAKHTNDLAEQLNALAAYDLNGRAQRTLRRERALQIMTRGLRVVGGQPQPVPDRSLGLTASALVNLLRTPDELSDAALQHAGTVAVGLLNSINAYGGLRPGFPAVAPLTAATMGSLAQALGAGFSAVAHSVRTLAAAEALPPPPTMPPSAPPALPPNSPPPLCPPPPPRLPPLAATGAASTSVSPTRRHSSQ
jgi:hypothetical protein